MSEKGHIPFEIIEEIKRRTDIVDMVSEYMTLKKAGRNYVGLCPFHKEKTPSFTVSREKQIFYCFGCGTGGNIITFLMKARELSFPEVVRSLAKKAGIVIPERSLGPKEKEMRTRIGEIRRVNDAAADFYTRCLFSPEGKGAQLYLSARGMREETIREFRLGFAPGGWRNLKDFLESQRIALSLAEQAGLIIQKGNENGTYYDRFRERIIFPIEDSGGSIIAFGGRILEKGEPKYLNTPESPVYSKGKTLYGLSRTKDFIRSCDAAILVEGYFDLLSLWNEGIKNVVATLGTALTREHVDLIRRYTSNVVVVFDPDEAGKKALERSMELFLSAHMYARVVVLPAGCDPDQYVRTYGKESFLECVDQASPMVDYYIDHVIGDGDIWDVKKRTTVKDAVSFIRRIPDVIERNLFIKRVSQRLGIDQELLKEEVGRVLEKSAGENKKGLEAMRPHVIDAVELSVIRIMLEYPRTIQQVRNENLLGYFMDKDLQSIGYELIKAYEESGMERIDQSFFLQRIENDTARRRIFETIMTESPYSSDVIDRVFADAVKQIKRKWFKERNKALNVQISRAEKSGDRELCERLLKEKEKILQEEKMLRAIP